MKTTEAFLSLFTIFSVTCNLALSSDAPVIGILSQEQTDRVVSQSFPNTTTYIYATYVKAVESAGGRVVPILPGKNESFYRNLLSSINGVLLPGGNASFGQGPYFDTAKMVYEIALELNEQGKFFPVFGVCLGFEFLSIFATDDNILKKCAVEREYLPIKFSVPPQESLLFSLVDMDQYTTLQFDNATMHLHSWCLTVDDFNANENLTNDWMITATANSRENEEPEFVAAMEHINYPIFAVVFHPEVAPFEWSNPALYPRSENIVEANLYFYRNFVHYSRQNNHSFEAVNKNTPLIFNYPVTYTQFSTGGCRQMYLF